MKSKLKLKRDLGRDTDLDTQLEMNAERKSIEEKLKIIYSIRNSRSSALSFQPARNIRVNVSQTSLSSKSGMKMKPVSGGRRLIKSHVTSHPTDFVGQVRGSGFAVGRGAITRRGLKNMKIIVIKWLRGKPDE